MLNYDTLIRFLYENTTNEKELIDALKTRLIIEPNCNKQQYLTKLLEQEELFFNLFTNTITKFIVTLNTNTNSIDKNERKYTPKELATIFHITKGNVHHWIQNGIITTFEQNIKGGTIKIPSSEIDRLTESLPKYRNFWINLKM